MADIGFGVIGLGMGKHHCKAIEIAPGAHLTAVCDSDADRLRPAAEEYGCLAYADYADLLANDEIQVVSIATPSGTHADIGAAAAAAGKHLIVEKPADINPARIKQLTAAVKDNSVKAAGIFQSRFDPLNKRIREAIREDKLGKLIGVHGHLPWYRKQAYYEGPHGTWKGTWAMDGGGSCMNQGVHTVDLLQWLAGRVTGVMAMYGVFAHDIEAEDQTVALLRFESGALGTLYTTTCCYPGYDQRITLYGNAGSITKSEGMLTSWKLEADADGTGEQEMLESFGARSGKSSGSADPMAVSFDGHTEIIVDMMEAIREDRDPAITLDDACHAVEIIDAIYESGRSQKEISI